MKPQSISIVGKTSPDGKLMIINKNEMTTFFQKWPNHRVILFGSVYASGSTSSQIGYWYNKIVPDFRDAWKEKGELYTYKKTDEKLREMCPTFHEELPREETGGFSLQRIRMFNDLSITEAIEAIDYIRMVAAQEFDLVIEDPRRL